jgi:hypothetical protein
VQIKRWIKGCRRPAVTLLALLVLSAAGFHCGGAKDPVMEILAARADYTVELKGFTEKRGQWDEAVGTLLSIFVINDSDVTLEQLTVRLRRFGPGSQDVPLETRRLTLDVSDIATNRSAEIIRELPGFVAGSLDGLVVDLELMPAEEEYGEFPELADALAARNAAAQK